MHNLPPIVRASDFLTITLSQVDPKVYRPRNVDYLRPRNPYAPYKAKVIPLGSVPNEDVRKYIAQNGLFVVGYISFSGLGSVDYDFEQEILGCGKLLGADVVVVTEHFEGVENITRTRPVLESDSSTSRVEGNVGGTPYSADVYTSGNVRIRQQTDVVGQARRNSNSYVFLRYQKGSRGEEATKPYTYPKPTPTPPSIYPKTATMVADRTVSIGSKGSLKIPAGAVIEVTGYDIDAEGVFYKGKYLGTEFRLSQNEVKEPLNK